jgi:hypothetical protein
MVQCQVLVTRTWGFKYEGTAHNLSCEPLKETIEWHTILFQVQVKYPPMDTLVYSVPFCSRCRRGTYRGTCAAFARAEMPARSSLVRLVLAPDTMAACSSNALACAASAKSLASLASLS